MTKQKLYISARYSRKTEMAEAATRLARHFDLTSTWYTETHDASVQLAEISDTDLRHYAERDEAEVLAADIFLLFSESDQTFNRRGGRHVEFGIAMMAGCVMHVIGPRENIFHYLPSVKHYITLDQFIEEVTKNGR